MTDKGPENGTLLRCGTSGFSYDAWKGVFYPEGLPAKKRLEHYASRLPAVEINNTFYRMPRASVLEGWAERVPAEFRFALKVSRRITHFKRLKDAGEELGYLLETVKSLGDRLGPGLPQAEVPAAIETIIDTYLDLRQDDEQFLDTYRRVGIEPFKESVYGLSKVA